jgi:predicted acylesterase/phospholipase RssA
MKIALTFSGGGYRAAAFGLGALSYLHKINIGSKTLLEHISVLSTVSGGTITGARYAIGIKRNENFDTTYKSLYSFLAKTDLIDLACEKLSSDSNWDEKRVRNLINSFADIYDEHLFHHAKFGEIMNDAIDCHLKHISFNATEFANALQFRFQWSERILNSKDGDPERAIIGNYYYNIPHDTAKEIRMADIMAASSCFPGGFEPVNFPDDFVLNNEHQTLFSNQKYPVGLMDGGIVDNQGLEPVLLAEKRMQHNNSATNQETPVQNLIDLIIICDVASPYMESYQASQQNKSEWWKHLTPYSILYINKILFLLGLIGLPLSFYKNAMLGAIACTIVLTITTIIFCFAKLVRYAIVNSELPTEFFDHLTKLLKLKLFIFQNLFVNRFKSILQLSLTVFLKHVRRLNYNVIYKDSKWQNRRIMCALHELNIGDQTLQKKQQNGKLPDWLLPSHKLQEVVEQASKMGTTLWFTNEDLQEKNMLNILIACGQFTMCWNLLEYINNIKSDPTNINAEHLQLIQYEQTLRQHWEAFKSNPLFMLD